MASPGLFTDLGILKTIDAANNEGFLIKPISFGVSETAGDLISSRDITSINTQWYTGVISGVNIVDNNTVQFLCSVPPEQATDAKFVREIYVYAKDSSNVDFLLAFAQPSSELVYDPDGDLRIRLQLKISNLNIANLYSFNYTQADELSDHNLDPNAHPVIQSALNKAGIYVQSSDNKFNGQNFDGFPNIIPSLLDKKIVYWNTTNNRYELAIEDGTEMANAIGVYDADNNIVVTSGIINLNHGLPPYISLYLSDTSFGEFAISESNLKIGHTLTEDRFFVSIEKTTGDTVVNVDGDISLTLQTGFVKEMVLESPDSTRYKVVVSNEGILSTELSTADLSYKFKMTKPDISFAEIKVDDDGILYVNTPVDDISILTDDSFYIKSDNGTAWKFTISQENYIVMVSYDNSFSIVADNGIKHFAIKQVNPIVAFTGIQQVPETYFDDSLDVNNYTSILASTPSVSYMITRRIDEKHNQLMMNHGNSITKLAGYTVGDCVESALSLSLFQKYYDTTWVLMNGQNVSGSDYETITGNATVPNSPTPAVGISRYIKINF